MSDTWDKPDNLPRQRQRITIMITLCLLLFLGLKIHLLGLHRGSYGRLLFLILDMTGLRGVAAEEARLAR